MATGAKHAAAQALFHSIDDHISLERGIAVSFVRTIAFHRLKVAPPGTSVTRMRMRSLWCKLHVWGVYSGVGIGHRPSVTVTRFPCGFSFTMGNPHQSFFPCGSRAVHGSQVLSESTKVVSNRPLSPNLILKKPQLSAAYSISHRIFGASLASAILITPILMKFSVIFDA